MFEGAWAWHHFIVDGTNARLSLPQKTPILYISFSFCSWYSYNRYVPLNFNVNNTCLEDIIVWYSQKKEEGSTRLSGLDELDHSTDSDEDGPRDDMGVTTTPVEQPKAPIAITLDTPSLDKLVAEGPSSGLKSPS